jgi:release factor glutamine methyltransferase
MVDRRVLIPRPETEEVVEVALRLVRATPRPWICADLGTGSGAIGLSLASELPVDAVSVWLTDLSPDALDVARANLSGLGRAAGHVRVAEGSWFDALPAELRGELALVVANPPYIAESEPVEPIVSEWEPAAALYGGTDGLEAIRRIVDAAPPWLRPGGWLVLEIGETQGQAVAGLLRAAGLGAVEILRDASRRERIAVARRDPSVS